MRSMMMEDVVYVVCVVWGIDLGLLVDDLLRSGSHLIIYLGSQPLCIKNVRNTIVGCLMAVLLVLQGGLHC